MSGGDGLRDRRRLAAVGQASVALGGVPLSMDAVAEVAARVTDAPVGVVSLVDGEWDRLLGMHGIGGVFGLTRRIAVADSLCQQVVDSGEPVWIDDTAADPRFAGAAVVSYLAIGAFAAVPLRGADDAVVGSVCALDFTARTWTPRHQAALAGVAATTGLLPGVAGVAGELTVNLLDLVPLLDALAEAFIAIDPGGAILAWNAAATVTFGWTREQAVGRMLHELLFPDRDGVTVRAVLATLAALSADQQSRPRHQTMWATTRDGKRIPVDATIRALPGATGPRICASMLDISDRINARADADRHEGLLNALLTSLDTAVFACDTEGRPIFANPALRRLLNLSTDALPAVVAELRAHVVGPDGRPLAPGDYPSARALAGETVRDQEMTLAPPRVAPRLLLANAEQVLVNGNVEGSVIALHDVTEDRRAARLREGELAVARVLVRSGSPQQVASAIADGIPGSRARLWLLDLGARPADTLRLLAAAGPAPGGDRSEAGHVVRAALAAEGPVWHSDDPAVAVPVRSGTELLGVLSLETGTGTATGERPTLSAHLVRIAADLAPYLEQQRRTLPR